MSLQPLVPALMAAMALTIAVMVWAAATAQQSVSMLSATVFATAITIVGVLINRHLWPPNATTGERPALHAARRNARLMAMVYAWGAAAMYAVYMLTDLWWWHSWQYGAAMALIAASLIAFVHLAGDPASFAGQPSTLDATAVMSLVQAVAAAAAIGFLIRSGKLTGTNTDWAANHVFLAGGAALICLSLIAAYTHWRLRGTERRG